MILYSQLSCLKCTITTIAETYSTNYIYILHINSELLFTICDYINPYAGKMIKTRCKIKQQYEHTETESETYNISITISQTCKTCIMKSTPALTESQYNFLTYTACYYVKAMVNNI